MYKNSTMTALNNLSVDFSAKIIKLVKEKRDKREGYPELLLENLEHDGLMAGVGCRRFLNNYHNYIASDNSYLVTAIKTIRDTSFWLEIAYNTGIIEKKLLDSLLKDSETMISLLKQLVEESFPPIKEEDYVKNIN